MLGTKISGLIKVPKCHVCATVAATQIESFLGKILVTRATRIPRSFHSLVVNASEG